MIYIRLKHERNMKGEQIKPQRKLPTACTWAQPLTQKLEKLAGLCHMTRESPRIHIKSHVSWDKK